MAAFWNKEETVEFADNVLLKAVRILVKQQGQQREFKRCTFYALTHAVDFASSWLTMGITKYLPVLDVILSPHQPFWQDTVSLIIVLAYLSLNVRDEIWDVNAGNFY